jgi:UDP-2,3-diacylglucosamine hydrolase
MATQVASTPVGPARFEKPNFSELSALAHWRNVDFISDLHLQSSEQATFDAWTAYLRNTQADALFILGDLFEVWVGDDVATEDGFERQCAKALKQASQRLSIYFMHGNRDFLVGQDFMGLCGSTLLNDPTVLSSGNRRWLLSHGDKLCIDDVDYQRFRVMVRSNPWQQDFLNKPLLERQSIARGMRSQSEAHKKSAPTFVDVDAAAATQWLLQSRATTLIHGHTHQPAEHDLGQGLQRIVMSDWDAAAQPPRAQVLRLHLPDSNHSTDLPTLKRYYINSKLSILFAG